MLKHYGFDFEIGITFPLNNFFPFTEKSNMYSAISNGLTSALYPGNAFSNIFVWTEPKHRELKVKLESLYSSDKTSVSTFKAALLDE